MYYHYYYYCWLLAEEGGIGDTHILNIISRGRDCTAHTSYTFVKYSLRFCCGGGPLIGKDRYIIQSVKKVPGKRLKKKLKMTGKHCKILKNWKILNKYWKILYLHIPEIFCFDVSQIGKDGGWWHIIQSIKTSSG